MNSLEFLSSLLPSFVQFLLDKVQNKIESAEELKRIESESISEVPNGEEVIRKLSTRFPSLSRKNQDANELAIKIFKLGKEEKIEFSESSRSNTEKFLRKKFNIQKESIQNYEELVEKVSKLLPLLDFAKEFQRNIEPINIESLKSELEEIEIRESSSEELYREWILSLAISLEKLSEDLHRFWSYLVGKDISDYRKIQFPVSERLITRMDVISSLGFFMNPATPDDRIKELVEELKEKYKKRADDVISGLYAFRQIIFYSYYMLILALVLENKKFIEDQVERNILVDINNKTKAWGR